MQFPNYLQTNFKGIIDTTLREGMQFVRADFSLAECRHIVHYLDLIGIEYIELGNPVNPHLREILTSVLRLDLQTSKILCHIRNRSRDLQAALDAEISGVNILCTADTKRIESMGKKVSEYQKDLRENVICAKTAGLEVRVSIEDYFNQPNHISQEFVSFAASLHVNRIGVADTLGNTSNWKVYEQIRFLRSLTEIDLEVHMHNDLGNAVSNSIWAVIAGANWIDTTLLGIGERTGIPSLSSILMNLHVESPQQVEKYDLSRLTEAENYIAAVCGIDSPFNLTTTQENAFAHKSGIHLDAIKKFGASTYEPFPASLIGNKSIFITDSEISGSSNVVSA